VGDDIEAMRFNTAIAKMMELVNEMSKEEKISPITYRTLIQLLSPFAPHMCEELWSMLGNKESISTAPWPQFDLELTKESTLTIAIQINGKVRDEITIEAETSEDEVKKLALASEKVQKWLEGKEPKKIIYVKGKLVSIVV
jgi:leucyl-tRNA synthetase